MSLVRLPPNRRPTLTPTSRSSGLHRRCTATHSHMSTVSTEWNNTRLRSDCACPMSHQDVTTTDKISIALYFNISFIGSCYGHHYWHNSLSFKIVLLLAQCHWICASTPMQAKTDNLVEVTSLCCFQMTQNEFFKSIWPWCSFSGSS